MVAGGGAWNGFWASDPEFWSVNRERFPNGLAPLVQAARARKMRFGLWFAPDTSHEGVNLDEELVKMTTYQQAFNASARMITAANEMYDALLAMI